MPSNLGLNVRISFARESVKCITPDIIDLNDKLNPFVIIKSCDLLTAAASWHKTAVFRFANWPHLCGICVEYLPKCE